jgi:hypothetical protein
LVENKDDAEVFVSIAAWTNDTAVLGSGEELTNNPDWPRVVIIDEMDHFQDATHM